MNLSAPFIQLAPMEGVLDWILRELLSEIGGVDRMVTEFVRVTDKLLPDHVFYKYAPELKTEGKTRFGTPVFVQLLGGQPQPMAENAFRAYSLGAPGIDLNFGCPAKTVNRHDGGAVLLKTPERLLQIISAVKKALPQDCPVTAKVRLGFEHKDLRCEIAQAAEEGGADHLVVHARTKMEMYQPPAHWDALVLMKQKRTIPFLANGDIFSLDDYKRSFEITGLKDIALGRGLVRTPTLARRIRGEEVEFDRLEFLNRFFHMSLSYLGGPFAIGRLKQLLRYWAQADIANAPLFERAKFIKSLDQAQDFFKTLSFQEDNNGRHSNLHLVELPLLRAREGLTQEQTNIV